MFEMNLKLLNEYFCHSSSVCIDFDTYKTNDYVKLRGFTSAIRIG